jgi:hypothetical protein
MCVDNFLMPMLVFNKTNIGETIELPPSGLLANGDLIEVLLIFCLGSLLRLRS